MDNNDYIKCISDLEKAQLMSEYELYVSLNPNCYELFRSQGSPDKPLFGFHVTPFRFTQMVSYIGVDKWLIRFGSDITIPATEPRFCLIATGIDTQGNTVTPNFRLKLCNHCESILEQGEGELSSHVVGTSLKLNWTKAWFNLVHSQNIPQSICKNSYGIIKGYNFSAMDFIDVANNSALFSGEIMIEFRIVNHAAAVTVPPGNSDDQTSLPGSLGIMIGHVQKISSTPLMWEQKSYYYDISSPCPPTCPNPS